MPKYSQYNFNSIVALLQLYSLRLKITIHNIKMSNHNNGEERQALQKRPYHSISSVAIHTRMRQKGRNHRMAQSNKIVVPEAKAAMEQFKMQAANEVGVTLNKGYNGDLTSRQAGSIGGQMVKKMIESYENSIGAK